MKKIYTLIISILLILNQAKAQVPQGFKYQTAIRDNNGTVLANKLVAIKLSLLMGTANGTTVYSELHKVATNDFGVANLNVGAGNVSFGNFSTIDWGSNSFFLKTEVDVNNGTNFVFMGTSQLLSVPFAMYAAKSANAANDKDQDSTNEIQTISLNNNTLQLSKNGGNIDLTKYDKDSQQLVLNGNTLSITKGNSIVLSGAVDLDADPTNEIQNLSLVNDTVKLSKANFVVLPKNYDNDSTNEIQSLSIVNDSLQLSKSNKVAFPKDNDRDSLNELQTIQQVGNNLLLSKNGGIVKVPSVTNIQNGSILYANATGVNNFILTLSDSISSYVTGMTVNFKVPNSNTGHVTVNINNLGIKPLFKNVSDTMESDDLLQNKMLSIIYDGQKFQLLNQLQNNYPKSDFAHFLFDTLPGSSISYTIPSKTWSNAIKINKTNIISGNSISRNEDTIILKTGIYKIKCNVYSASSIYQRIRLRDVINNQTLLIGYPNVLGFGGYWNEIDGFIVVNNLVKFKIQIYLGGDGNLNVSHASDSVNNENEIDSSIIIERIR